MAQDKDKKTDEESLEGPSTIIKPTEPAKEEEAPASPASQDEVLDSNSAGAGGEDQPPKKSSLANRLRGFSNLYFVIFLLLLLVIAGGIYAAIKIGNNNNTSQTKIQSLTDKQIADLKGNTTLVGDSQQTLDIQGNSIFEGQVLMRNNLDVAGSIKVGGNLSLPAITVGGSSSFGQIQVTKTLAVKGDTTMQGRLTVQQGLSVSGSATFGALSASQINVSSLQLVGDFTVSRHLNVSGGIPSRSNGAALGAGGTASVNGADTAGTVTINTGGSPPAGCFVTINFAQRYNATPHVVISPSNSSAARLNYYTNRNSASFSICTTNTPSASTTYLFDYIVID